MSMRREDLRRSLEQQIAKVVERRKQKDYVDEKIGRPLASTVPSPTKEQQGNVPGGLVLQHSYGKYDRIRTIDTNAHEQHIRKSQELKKELEQQVEDNLRKRAQAYQLEKEPDVVFDNDAPVRLVPTSLLGVSKGALPRMRRSPEKSLSPDRLRPEEPVQERPVLCKSPAVPPIQQQRHDRPSPVVSPDLLPNESGAESTKPSLRSLRGFLSFLDDNHKMEIQAKESLPQKQNSLRQELEQQIAEKKLRQELERQKRLDDEIEVDRRLRLAAVVDAVRARKTREDNMREAASIDQENKHKAEKTDLRPEEHAATTGTTREHKEEQPEISDSPPKASVSRLSREGMLPALPAREVEDGINVRNTLEEIREEIRAMRDKVNLLSSPPPVVAPPKPAERSAAPAASTVMPLPRHSTFDEVENRSSAAELLLRRNQTRLSTLKYARHHDDILKAFLLQDATAALRSLADFHGA